MLNPNDLIDTKKASNILNLSLRQTQHLVKTGKLRIAFGSLGRGKQVFLDRNEVLEFAKKKRGPGRPKTRIPNEERAELNEDVE